MNKFKTWLNNTPGMATKLRARLKVSAATISNVKHGRRPMPVRWFPTIVALSGGLLTHEELVKARIKDTT